MGMEQHVTYSPEKTPAWPAVRALLAQRGYPVQCRMIDGELSFPDEDPPDDWRELRLGTPQGMITVRRQPGRLALVTWGNADAGLVQAWNALTWAFAEACDGQIQTEGGTRAPRDYLKTADLPAALRTT
jgi:hypothetical protein